MTKEQIFEIVKQSILEILPDLSPSEIHIEGTLKELGANSIDRMEVTVMSMESLGLKAPLVDFAQVKNIQGLVDVLYQKKMGA